MLRDKSYEWFEREYSVKATTSVFDSARMRLDYTDYGMSDSDDDGISTTISTFNVTIDHTLQEHEYLTIGIYLLLTGVVFEII